MHNLWRRVALAFALTLTAIFVAAAEPENSGVKEIRFEKGHTSATVKGAIHIAGAGWSRWKGI